MFNNLSIKSKLVTLVLLATLTIAVIVSISFRMLLSDVFLKDVNAKMENGVVHLAYYFRNAKQNLIDSTSLVIHNLNIDSELNEIYNNPNVAYKEKKEKIALKLLDQLKYSFMDEIYVYDSSQEVVAFAMAYKDTYLYGYQLGNKEKIIFTKLENETEFSKEKKRLLMPKKVYQHIDPFSIFATTGHYRVFKDNINILSHKKYINDNNVIGSISMVKVINKNYIKQMSKKLNIDMKYLISDEDIKAFKREYQIDVKNNNISIPPLLSNIRNSLSIIDSKDEFISIAAIQTDDNPIYVINKIKKNLLDEVVLKSQKNFFLIILIFTILLIIISIYIINKIIANPLHRISNNIKLIEKGDYNLKSLQDNGDEIGRISQIISDMAYTIQNREKELKNNADNLLNRNLELKKQEMYLKKSQEIAHIGVWDFNVKDDNLYWSDEIYSIFGLNKDEFEPSYVNLLKSIPTDDRGRLDKEYATSIDEKREYYTSHYINCADGSSRCVEERGTHYYDEAGEHIKTIGIILDITERDELEKKLLSLNKNLDSRVKEEVEKNRKKDKQMFQQSRLAQMGEMISMIAHQWRQPLSAISATSMDLQMKLVIKDFDPKDEKSEAAFFNYFKESFKSIDSFVQSLTTTIDDFRNFYKPNKESVITTLESAVDKALNIINGSLEMQGVKIIYDYRSHNKLRLYENELMQVILNILKNAQDNFKEKEIENPQITITIKEDSISIYDNGGGIPEDIIEKVFDPYFSTKDERNGTGLGLYMSRTIVQDHHNGKLSAINQGKGVCFTIKIGDID